MPTPSRHERLRVSIGRNLRRLRQDRRWTQQRLAGLLGLSQNRLSEIEYGKGSITAEQLLIVLKNFNVPIDEFGAKQDHVDELQNALARLGARHLSESDDTLPTERLRDTLVVIREALAAAEPRQITALTPVLVEQIDNLNLTRIWSDLADVGLERRLGWVLENSLWALEKPEGGKEIRAALLFRAFLGQVEPRRKLLRSVGEDRLDTRIGSEKTLEELRSRISKISRSWGIVTRIQPEDFLEALREARGAH